MYAYMTSIRMNMTERGRRIGKKEKRRERHNENYWHGNSIPSHFACVQHCQLTCGVQYEVTYTNRFTIGTNNAKQYHLNEVPPISSTPICLSPCNTTLFKKQQYNIIAYLFTEHARDLGGPNGSRPNGKVPSNVKQITLHFEVVHIECFSGFSFGSCINEEHGVPT